MSKRYTVRQAPAMAGPMFQVFDTGKDLPIGFPGLGRDEIQRKADRLNAQDGHAQGMGAMADTGTRQQI